MKKYFYLPKGAFYAFDIWAKNETEARAEIRTKLGKRSLLGVQIWKA